MIQRKYYFDKQKNVIESIRKSEQDFHNNHTPLYANYLFGNRMTMHKIERWLSGIAPVGTIIRQFDVSKADDNLNNGAISCGLELVNGKIDYEFNYQIAKCSQNAFVYCIESLDDDYLALVRDESLSDNTFVLKYILDNDDDESEIEDLPDGMDVEISKLPSKVTA